MEKKNFVCPSPNDAKDRIKSIYGNDLWENFWEVRFRHNTVELFDDSDESLDMLVNWYLNKNSKRVAYAGNKLKKIFLSLPPVEQRKVGMALLTGGLVDTEFVYRRLRYCKTPNVRKWENHWHPCYASSIERCWNQFHGKFCGLVLIDFLEEKCVRKYVNELNEPEYYKALCCRFVGKPWLKLDVESLKKCTDINTYLFVMSQTKQGISAEEARSLLYQWIAVVVVHDGGKLANRIFSKPLCFHRRIINAWGIDVALYYLLLMDHQNVVEEFLKWDELVSEKYEERLNNSADAYENPSVFIDVILENFPEEMLYLTQLDEECYSYIEKPSQPFTVPRLNMQTMEDDEFTFSYPDRMEIIQTSEQELEMMMERNPVVEKFVRQFDCDMEIN